MGLINPRHLALKLGVHPPKIYQLIKKGRIKEEVGLDGKKLIDEEAATRVVKMTTRVPRDKDSNSKIPASKGLAKPGDIASWGRERKERRICMCVKTNDLLTEFKDLEGKSVTFMTSSLEKQITSGRVVIHKPDELLKMLYKQLILQGNEERANEIKGVIHDED